MRPLRRRYQVIAITLTVAAIASGCSTSRDTTQLSTDKPSLNEAVPTTSITRGTIDPTTTIAPLSDSAELLKPAGPQDTLTALISQFTLDTDLLDQLNSLSNLDMAGVAKLLGIDLSAIDELGLSVGQITALAQSVASSTSAVQGDLLASTKTGDFDPGILIGLLTSSVDVSGVVNGTIAQLVNELTASIAPLDFDIDPKLNAELSSLLKELDPQGLGSIAANPANASLLAVLTSAFISVNPEATEQILGNPLIDPRLRNLLSELQQMGAGIGDVANAALLTAINQLFPGLIPRNLIPGG